MLGRITCAALACTLTACAHPGRAGLAPTEQIEAAASGFEECLAAIEPAQDDGISDAGTIARSISTECLDQWGHYLALKKQGQPQARVNALMRQEQQLRREVALKVVLAARAQRAHP